MAFVGAIVRDPAADGERLAEVLDTELVAYEHGDAVDVPHCALDLGDCMLALYPIPPDESTSRAVWGGVYERPRCVALGLSVPDQGSPSARSRPRASRCTTAPATGARCSSPALPFPVVLTDQLLAGDPRTTQEER